MALRAGEECVPSVQCEAGLFVVEEYLIPGLRRMTAGASVTPHELLECPLVMIGVARDALQRLKCKDRCSSSLCVTIPAEHGPVGSSQRELQLGMTLQREGGRNVTVFCVAIGAVLVSRSKNAPMVILMTG